MIILPILTTLQKGRHCKKVNFSWLGPAMFVIWLLFFRAATYKIVKCCSITCNVTSDVAYHFHENDSRCFLQLFRAPQRHQTAFPLADVKISAVTVVPPAAVQRARNLIRTVNARETVSASVDLVLISREVIRCRYFLGFCKPYQLSRKQHHIKKEIHARVSCRLPSC